VLEGSVRRSGKRTQSTQQLVNNCVDGYHIWSEVHDSDIEDIFQVQDETSLKILTRLKENSQQRKNETRLLSHQQIIQFIYLRVLQYRNSLRRKTFKSYFNSFEKSTADPDFALPYCAIFYCYSYMGSTGIMPPAEAFSKAKEYTLKAIEIDPNQR